MEKHNEAKPIFIRYIIKINSPMADLGNHIKSKFKGLAK